MNACNLSRRIALALALSTVAAGVSIARGTQPAHEQTVFREGESLQHPVPLPPKVLHMLLQMKEVKEALQQFANDKERSNPSQLFQASEVHLGSFDEADLVVEGFPPISGADNSWFWIVFSARNTPKVALWAGGDSLEVMARRTNGYKDIECHWSSASGYTRKWKYHFDGQKYTLWKEIESHNR